MYPQAADVAGVTDKQAQRYAAMAHNNVCVEYDKAGRYDEAHRHCTLAVDKATWKFWMPHKTLGLITEKWGDTDTAREHYLTAHRLKRNDPLVLHAATMLPLVYDSQEDVDNRRSILIREVDKLKQKSLKIDVLF